MQPGVRFQRCLGQLFMRADHRIMGLFSVGRGDRSDDDAFSHVAHREVLRHPRIRAAHEKGDSATSDTDGVEVRKIRSS